MSDQHEKLAARHIQAATGVPYTHALEAARTGRPPRGWTDQDTTLTTMSRARLARAAEKALNGTPYSEDLTPLLLVAAAAIAAIKHRPQRICGNEEEAIDPHSGDQWPMICRRRPHDGECFPDGVNYSMWRDEPDDAAAQIASMHAGIEEFWRRAGGSGDLWSSVEAFAPLVANPHAAEDWEYWWARESDLAPFHAPTAE